MIIARNGKNMHELFINAKEKLPEKATVIKKEELSIRYAVTNSIDKNKVLK